MKNGFDRPSPGSGPGHFIRFQLFGKNSKNSVVFTTGLRYLNFRLFRPKVSSQLLGELLGLLFLDAENDVNKT